MKHYILVNPVSGNKRGEKYGIIIQKLLKKYNIDSQIIVSKEPEHLTKIAKELSINEKCRFYSVGGDGTLNEVVCGAIGSDSDIVVIPCGTGNDFIKTISKYKGMRKIVLNSINKESKKIDILKVNDRYCVNILSVGFDSFVAANLDKFRNVPFISGKAKYNLSIFYSLMTNRNFKLKLRIDKDIIYKKQFTLIALANGKYYGGGVCACPEASVFDNIMDICAINQTSVIQKLFFLPFYSKGKHLKFKIVNFNKGKTATIVSTRKFPANVDGEVFYTNKMKITVCHEAVNIVCID